MLQTPAEKLTALCSISTETDLDTFLKSLDPDEFIVESIKKEKSSQSKFPLTGLFLKKIKLSLEVKQKNQQFF